MGLVGFRASARLRTPVVVLCLALGAALPVCASGQKEPGIEEAVRLIDQKEYTAAIKLLAQLRLSNPDLRDASQQLLDRINVLQQQYNKVLDELHTALYVQNDVPRAEQLMSELQQLDPGQSVQQAQQAVQFIRFVQRMNDAESLLSQEKYGEALAAYVLPLADPTKAELDLEWPAFQTAGYGSLVITSVQEDARKLQQLVEDGPVPVRGRRRGAGQARGVPGRAGHGPKRL